MARILYSIAKEGMGHTIRSRVIIEHLRKKHDVLVLAGGEQFDYLSNYFKKIKRINDFDLVYLNNSVSFTLTFFRNFFRLPIILYSILHNRKHIAKFNPDVIISDFEPLSNYLSLYLKKPLVSVDNQHVSTTCNVRFPKKFEKDFIISSLVISSIITNACYYLILSYFYPKVKKKNAFLFSPVIREKIRKAKPVTKEHIIVYQTSDSYKKLVQTLKNTKFHYIFYCHREAREENIVFKKFSEDEFIKDLTSCKAVITNGGFGLISEAIYLKKPVLSIPIKKQFEQILNAVYLKKLGYGTYYMDISEEIIIDFVNNLSTYRKNLSGSKNFDNKKLYDKLEDIIFTLTKD